MDLVRPVSLLLLIALLSGCVEMGDPSVDSAGPEGEAPSEIPSGQPETSPATVQDAVQHGSAAREESAVTVSREGDRYVARKTVTLSNDFGGASQASVALKTVNGAVSAEAWSEAGYRTVAKLSARAATEQEARSNLAKMDVTHSDRLAAGKLTLATAITFPSNVNNLAGSLESSLPGKPAYVLDLATTNGVVDVGGLGGPSVAARTTNGAIGLQASFNSVIASTDNGAVELDGTFNRGDIDVTNGAVRGSVRSTASGSWDVDTVNGEVDLAFSGDGVGYDAEGSCSNGSVSLAFPGAEAVGSQTRTSKHVRTTGFASKAIQVSIDASTVNGDVELSA